jgi:hypothetical protein
LSVVTGSVDGVGAYAYLLEKPDVKRIPIPQQVVHRIDLRRQLRASTVQPNRTAPVPRDEAPAPSPSRLPATAREFERIVQHAVAQYHATLRRELGDRATRCRKAVEEERLYRHIREVGRPGDDA